MMPMFSFDMALRDATLTHERLRLKVIREYEDACTHGKTADQRPAHCAAPVSRGWIIEVFGEPYTRNDPQPKGAPGGKRMSATGNSRPARQISQQVIKGRVHNDKITSVWACDWGIDESYPDGQALLLLLLSFRFRD